MDIDSLLNPISATQPTGLDARVEPGITESYYHLKDARTTARAAERTSLFDNASSEIPEWVTILTKAPQILCEQTKDLEICCWYTEALIRKEGFTGLQLGFKLIRGLIENYWNELYPLPDEDGLETRVAPLTGLNGSGSEGVLIAPIRNVKITSSSSHPNYSLWQYQQALDMQKIHDEDERQNRSRALGFSLTEIQQSVSETPDAFYIQIIDNIQSCISDYKAISNKLDEYCDADTSPPSRNIINVLEECQGAVKHLAGEIISNMSKSTEEFGDDDTDDITNKANPQSKDQINVINSREDAFKQLLKISDFFKKTEPHSPLAAILQRAVNWGNMPLEQLIQELIPDHSSREHYKSLTGINLNDN
jgi:type VI secretion system protein ImpA